MIDRDHLKLLFGPYRVPPLKRGDRTECLCRDAEVVVFRLERRPHPLAALPSRRGRGRGPGLLIDTEWARAVRHKSAAAVAH